MSTGGHLHAAARRASVGSPETRGRRAPSQRRQGAALPAMWQNSSSRPSIRRGSARHGARPRSGSSWSRHPLTGCKFAWRLSLYGLRRSEVLGLRCSDIDLRVRTLTADQAPVLVEYRVRIEEPKSRNGKRTLPLDGELVATLTAQRTRQLDESTIMGTACQSRVGKLGWYQGGEYVISDEAGTPVHPEWRPQARRQQNSMGATCPVVVAASHWGQVAVPGPGRRGATGGIGWRGSCG